MKTMQCMKKKFYKCIIWKKYYTHEYEVYEKKYYIYFFVSEYILCQGYMHCNSSQINVLNVTLKDNLNKKIYK